MTIPDATLAALTAGLAEDEAIARAATAGEWEWSDLGLNVHGGWTTCQYYCAFSPNDPMSRGEPKTPGHEHRFTTAGVVGAVGYDNPRVEVSDADAAHIARQQPRQTLRQVEVFQRVLKLHAEAERDSALSDRDAGFEAGVYATIELLAGIYTPEESS